MLRLACACAVSVALTWNPAGADAGEEENSLSLRLSYGAYLVEEDFGSPGLAGTLDYRRGLTDTLWARCALSGGVFLANGDSFGGSAIIGVEYSLDVLKYVPWIGLGAGVLFIDESEQFDRVIDPVIELEAGLDILSGRSFAYGPEIRFQSFASDTFVFLAGLRVSYRWGYF